MLSEAICVCVNTDKDSIIDMSVKFLYQIKYKGRVLLYTALLRQYKGLLKLGSCEESLKNCDFYAIRGGARGRIIETYDVVSCKLFCRSKKSGDFTVFYLKI